MADIAPALAYVMACMAACGLAWFRYRPRVRPQHGVNRQTILALVEENAALRRELIRLRHHHVRRAEPETAKKAPDVDALRRDWQRRVDLAHLGLDPDATHDQQALKRAFQRRIKEAHPDIGGSPDALRLAIAAYGRLKVARAR